MKEFLSRARRPFVEKHVEDDPAAYAELIALGWRVVFQPKRVSVWSADRKLATAFCGPSEYGGGGRLDPRPTRRGSIIAGWSSNWIGSAAPTGS